jgi:transcriptional regulator with XRE-family HTH domain
MAKKKPEEAPGLIKQLRGQIRQDGRSLSEIARASGVDAPRLSRFMAGKRGLSIEALDAIFRALRLTIVPQDRPAGRRRPHPAKEEE